jgi:UDP:flavonoid glycosyltransferase YjiC (YdhE family)
MYALFTAVPLVGHVNPLLRQAEELQRRGWRVAFAGTSEMRAHVTSESPGTPFVDLGSLGPVAGRLRRQQEDASLNPDFAFGALSMVRGLSETWPVMFDGLMAAVATGRPSVIVSDFFTAAGACAAEAAGIPLVLNNADLLGAISARVLPPADHLPLLFSGRSRAQVKWWDRLAAPMLRTVGNVMAGATVGRDLNRQRQSRGLAAVDIHERQRDTTILVNGAFGLEYERPLPANVHMVGVMLPPAPPALGADEAAWLADGPPVIYCNLGTLAVAPTGQIDKMADAFNRGPWRVLWTLRPRDRWPVVAPHVRLVEWGSPPMAVTSHPNVRVFVSHCGINSVHESITAGVPLVGLPMFADQRDMAVRVADAGAGLWLNKHQFTAVQLAQAVHRVATDDRFQAALPPLQRALREAGGTPRAADLIAARAGSQR